MDAKATPMSRRKIQQLACSIRDLAGVKNDSPFPILRFLEFFQVILGLDIEIVPDSFLVDCYAITKPGTKTIQIRESVYDGAANGNAHDIFTLAHELGHFIMHTPDRISFARGQAVRSYEKPEWQANVFAAELLVPHIYIKKELSVEQIASRYGVSIKVAKIQKTYAKS